MSLPAGTRQQLEDLAEEEDVTLAQVVRWALKEFVKKGSRDKRS